MPINDDIDLTQLLITESEYPTGSDAFKPTDKLLRLKRSPSLFVRVPIQWLTKPDLPYPFRPSERLFLYLLFKSRWGAHGVKLTNDVASEVGVSPRVKQKCIKRWERQGWVRIEREGGQRSPVVWPLVMSG
jgi:hypothetical protein